MKSAAARFPRKSMSTNELQVSLPCVCGRNLIAGAKDAGGSIACDCGKSVAVPNLSKLRTVAGADPFVTNPAEAIRKLREQGVEPAGDKCLLCGSSHAVSYKCHAQCESSHVARVDSGETDDLVLLRMILNPFRGLLWQLFALKAKQIERRGHDIAVTFLLPICDPCAATAGNMMRAATAKQLMLKVPVYKELLEYYPKLQLKIERA